MCGTDRLALLKSYLSTRQQSHRPGTLQLAALPPLSLYVHLPWCLKKCPYCDFNSHEAPGDLPEQAYLDALMADLEQALPLVWGRGVHSIFIGGGTPSLFSPAGIDRLISDVRARLRLEPDCEITLEANPGSVEAGRFTGYRDGGVNRVSLGVQALNDTDLKALGRMHTAAEAMVAVGVASVVLALVPGILLGLVAAFFPRLKGPMAWMKRHMDRIERISGLLLWTVGLMMLTGQFSAFSYWLLETFPSLATLG